MRNLRMTIINTLKDTEKVNNMHDYMRNSRSNGICFLKKERSGHARKNIYNDELIQSAFQLFADNYLLVIYCCLVRFTSRGFKELQLIFPHSVSGLGSVEQFFCFKWSLLGFECSKWLPYSYIWCSKLWCFHQCGLPEKLDVD